MRFCSKSTCTCTTTNCYVVEIKGEKVNVRNRDTGQGYQFSLESFREAISTENLVIEEDEFTHPVYSRLRKFVADRD